MHGYAKPGFPKKLCYHYRQALTAMPDLAGQALSDQLSGMSYDDFRGSTITQ